jgi:hypothetical protein
VSTDDFEKATTRIRSIEGRIEELRPGLGRWLRLNDITMQKFADGRWECRASRGGTETVARGTFEELNNFLKDTGIP